MGFTEGEYKGKLEGAIMILLTVGQRRFGAADPRTIEAIRSSADLTQIMPLIERLLQASSWEERLATWRGETG